MQRTKHDNPLQKPSESSANKVNEMNIKHVHLEMQMHLSTNIVVMLIYFQHTRLFIFFRCEFYAHVSLVGMAP